jgi:glycosyltransferase involved in cell wall biosynthesis
MDLPLVLLEAMWMERAVVVAAGSPAAELADDAAAIAVDPRPEPLAAELDALVADPARRAVIGAAARRAAEERYHPDRMVRAYESIYDRLLGEAGEAR